VDLYKTKAVTGIRAVSYNGTNGDEIRAFLGDGNVIENGGDFQVHLSDGRWETLHPGWQATLTPGGERLAFSPKAFATWLERE
jgi:hypothetical protein